MERRKMKLVYRATILIICAGVVYLLTDSLTRTSIQICSHQGSGTITSDTETYSVKTKSSQLVQQVLRSYQYYHRNKKRELVRGKMSRTLTWYCVSGCGGIGDRVKGMQASFLLALVTNRTFFIHVSNEVQKTMFLEPNAIDWRPYRSCLEMPYEHTMEDFGRPSTFSKKFLGAKWNTTLEFNRLMNVDHLYISHKGNINILAKDIVDSKIGSNLSPLHRRLLHSLLEKESEDSMYYLVCILHHFLFKLPQQVMSLTNLKLAELKLRPHKFVTVHIRTGFKNTLFGEFLPSMNYLKGERFAATKDSWRQMLECAIKIANSTFGRNSKILIVSDDKEPKKWAASEYKSRIAMLDVDPVHVANRGMLGVFKSRPKDVYLDTWVELSVMSQSAAMVGIKSGYLDVASYIGDMDPHSIYTYSIHYRACRIFKRYLVET